MCGTATVAFLWLRCARQQQCLSLLIIPSAQGFDDARTVVKTLHNIFGGTIKMIVRDSTLICRICDSQSDQMFVARD